jgi:hypothetical protein
MTADEILTSLSDKGVVTPEQSDLISRYEKDKPFSIHWELRSILYLGILMFTGGLGVIIYQNIESIGHQVIIASIGILTAICFYHASKHRAVFSWEEVKSDNKLSDYVLLLGCTAFLILEGYLQFQYSFFGTRYGLAIIIPTVVFFFCAYLFDNRGVLSMAITGLASWLGLTIAPMSVLSGNDFSDVKLIITAITLGLALMVIGWITLKQNLKGHFSFTYLFLGGLIAMIASMKGLFDQEVKILYFAVSAGLCIFFIFYSRFKQELVFLLMGVIFGYIVITYALFKILPDNLIAFISVYYFLFTSVGVIFFLLNVKKILGLKK